MKGNKGKIKDSRRGSNTVESFRKSKFNNNEGT